MEAHEVMPSFPRVRAWGASVHGCSQAPRPGQPPGQLP